MGEFEIRADDLVDAAQLAACHLAGFYDEPIRLHHDGGRVVLVNEIPRALVSYVRGAYVVSPLDMPDSDFEEYARHFTG